MAVRRPPSLCLFCQSRQVLIGCRRIVTTKRRKLGILVAPSVDNGIALAERDLVEQNVKQPDIKAAGAPRTSVVVGDKLHTEELEASDNEDVRTALQALEALWERKDMRIKVLQTLSNPWPEVRHERGHNESRSVLDTKWFLPQAGGPIPHEVFRENLGKAPNEKVSRQILRAQLLRCHFPTDILRVMSVAMLRRQTQMHLSRLHEPIMRALYRCRANVDDKEVLRTLSTISARFRVYGLPVDPQLIALGLKFSARTRSLGYMKRFLKTFRDRKLYMSSNIFRSIIAKCSIGHRGLGEIRNGRWQRNELLQVLTGFEDCEHLPLEQQYHLGTFLDRSDWQYLHGWVAILARCRSSSAIWQEWELWKQNDSRKRPMNLLSVNRQMTTKLRGDYWFVEQMTYAGGLEQAWQILREAGIDFITLKERIRTRLLDGAEFITVWNDELRRDMIRKYEHDLSKIESALGLCWDSAGTTEGIGGVHVHTEDQDVVLERLADPDWKLEEDHGYPYNEPIVPQSEKSLHDAVETTPAEDAGKGI